MSESVYWVRHPATYAGHVCDFGQIIPLTLASTKAEQLTRLGYLVATEAKRGKEKVLCGACGAEFLSEGDRDAHGRKRHSARFQAGDPSIEDEREEREETQLLHRAPLYLENTEATRR